jgi:hypothetical protein
MSVLGQWTFLSRSQLQLVFKKEPLPLRGHFVIARAGLPLTLDLVRERGELRRAHATRANYINQDDW